MLSRLGSGRFYLIEDANRLPAVFAQETILAARSAIVEKDFQVGARRAVVDHRRHRTSTRRPPLKGYVVTIPKGRASVLLTGPEGDPILAVWSAGVGRAAAFTSDLKDRWGAEWTTWPGAARLVAQIARDVTRKGEDGRVRLEADASGGELHVRATVVGDDGRAQSFRRLMVRVAGPDGFSRGDGARGHGRRRVRRDASRSRGPARTSPSRATSSVGRGRRHDRRRAHGRRRAAADRQRRRAARRASPSSPAGKTRDTLAGIFADRAARRFSYQDMTPILIVLAAFGLLLAVAARRFALPEPLVAWAGRARAALRSKPSEHGQTGPDPRSPDAVVGALLQAKERAARDRAVSAAPPPSATPLAARTPDPTRPLPAPQGLPRPPAPPSPPPRRTRDSSRPRRSCSRAARARTDLDRALPKPHEGLSALDPDQAVPGPMSRRPSGIANGSRG